MRATVILMGRTGDQENELLRRVSLEVTSVPEAQRVVLKAIAQRVLGLEYSMNGAGEVRLVADAGQLDEATVGHVRTAVDAAFEALQQNGLVRLPG